MQLSLISFPTDPITPVDPIVPAACVQLAPSTVAGMTAASLCGQIKNPTGQTFLSGILFLGTLGEPLASVGIGGFSTDFSTADCPRIDIAGTLLIPDAYAASLRSNPGSWSLAFRSREYPLASVIGAFGTGPAGPVEQNEGASGVSRPKGSPCKVRLNSF
jgi:hypothetical protein